MAQVNHLRNSRKISPPILLRIAHENMKVALPSLLLEGASIFAFTSLTDHPTAYHPPKTEGGKQWIK